MSSLGSTNNLIMIWILNLIYEMEWKVKFWISVMFDAI